MCLQANAMFGNKVARRKCGSMAQVDARSTGDQERLRIRPPLGRQHSFVAIDHEIFSTVIPSLLLIQEGQLSVFGERLCTILVNSSED